MNMIFIMFSGVVFVACLLSISFKAPPPPLVQSSCFERTFSPETPFLLTDFPSQIKGSALHAVSTMFAPRSNSTLKAELCGKARSRPAPGTR